MYQRHMYEHALLHQKHPNPENANILQYHCVLRTVRYLAVGARIVNALRSAILGKESFVQDKACQHAPK